MFLVYLSVKFLFIHAFKFVNENAYCYCWPPGSAAWLLLARLRVREILFWSQISMWAWELTPTSAIVMRLLRRVEQFLDDCWSLTGWLWTCWDGEPRPMSCAPCKFSELLYVWLVFWGSRAYLGSVALELWILEGWLAWAATVAANYEVSLNMLSYSSLGFDSQACLPAFRPKISGCSTVDWEGE